MICLRTRDLIWGVGDLIFDLGEGGLIFDFLGGLISDI